MQQNSPRQRIDIAALLSDAQRGERPFVKIQAPMVRYSRPPFRRCCRLWGTDVAYTHMVIADSFVRSSEARQAEFQTYEGEGPLVVQLAANDPIVFAEAAKLLSPYCDAVEINCGCPQRWILNEGLGASLLSRPQLIAEIVQTTRRVAQCPCAVKIRVVGGGDGVTPTVDLARQVEAAGAAWLTVHGRTATDAPNAPVKFNTIRAVRDSLSCIPVVANGGVESLKSAEDISILCGTGGVMCGRGLLSNPALYCTGGAGSSIFASPEVVSDFVRLSAVYQSSLTCTMHHVQLMLRHGLSPLERQFVNDQGSMAGLYRCLAQAGYWTDAGRFTSAAFRG